MGEKFAILVIDEEVAARPPNQAKTTLDDSTSKRLALPTIHMHPCGAGLRNQTKTARNGTNWPLCGQTIREVLPELDLASARSNACRDRRLQFGESQTVLVVEARNRKNTIRLA